MRLGTPAVTTRGMGAGEAKQIGRWILKIVEHVKDEKLPTAQEERAPYLKNFRTRIKEDKLLLEVLDEVKDLCKKFPTPQ